MLQPTHAREQAGVQQWKGTSNAYCSLLNGNSVQKLVFAQDQSLTAAAVLCSPFKPLRPGVGDFAQKHFPCTPAQF